MPSSSFFTLPGEGTLDQRSIRYTGSSTSGFPIEGSRRLVHLELEERALGMPNEHWISFANGDSYTFLQAWKRVQSVASALQSLGVVKGDRIVLFLGNSKELVETWLAAHVIGAIVAPMNTALRGETAAHQVRLADPKVMVSDVRYLPQIETAVHSAPDLGVLVLSGNMAEVPATFRLAKFQLFPYGQWSATQAVPSPVDLEPWDHSSIAYTSGTTGASKAILWNHFYTLYMAEASAHFLEIGSKDIVYTCLPLFHVNALNMHLVPTLMTGGKIAIGERFSVTSFWKEVSQSKATRTNFLGSMVPLLLKKPVSDEERSHSVRKALTIPCPPEYYSQMQSRWGITPYEAYGLADFGMLTWTPLGTTARQGSCGIADLNFECKLVNEHDEEVPTGTVGEFVARPRFPWIASPGYWRDPTNTVNTWRNLWFHTGDYLKRDKEGWFYFVDRKKDAIRRRGENVSTFEVEQAVLAHPNVVDCAAYAVPSDFLEDEIAVAVVVSPGATRDPAEILKRAEPNLPYFALPRYVRYVDAIPRTANGKPQKRPLRDLGLKGDIWDREAVGYVVSR